VPATFADIADLAADTGFKPKNSLRQGIGHFVDWYLEYYAHERLRAVHPPAHDQLEDFSQQAFGTHAA
jgi:hypothetical protein